MIINAKSSFERAGRLHKVQALVRAIDGVCSSRKRLPVLHPIRDGERIAGIVENWDDEHWRKAALLAGVVPKTGKLPSLDTRAAVVAFYRERARQVAL